MSVSEVRPLDFSAVDDLAFAAERDRLNTSTLPWAFECRQLGPLLELVHLSRTGAGPRSLKGGWLDTGMFAGLGDAIASPAVRWASHDRQLGLLKTSSNATEVEWTAYAIDAKRAATSAGLSSDWAAQMVGALGEFRSNIIEHSGAENTGQLAYSSAPGSFEFVACDRGVGLLSTLREAPEYQALSDHGEALRLALTDGASRYGFDRGRGYGFRPLFTGLANRQATLRFRTGTAALVIDGATPSLVRAQVGKKARVGGFFITVACSVSRAA